MCIRDRPNVDKKSITFESKQEVKEDMQKESEVFDLSLIHIFSLILYYFFYIADAYIILSPIKKFKDKGNKKQIEFWQRTKINKKTFFNNLNYEIRKKYYSKENIWN